jgi:hypothetical protein
MEKGPISWGEIILGLKGFPGSNALAYWAHSQHFIFFVTYEWVLLARVLHCIRLERLSRDKHISLLGPFKYRLEWKY